MEKSLKPVRFLWLLDRKDLSYRQIWAVQHELVEAVALGRSDETIIFCEHEPVITLGRRAQKDSVITQHWPIVEIERGGDATLHAPGQLVIYPILKLNEGRFPGGLQSYLRFCEEILIRVLETYGLEAGRFGPTGVWIKNRHQKTQKIGSVGIAVKRWVTYHGISLNISNDLMDFRQIRPCGFDAEIMTSLKHEGIRTTVHEVAKQIENYLQIY